MMSACVTRIGRSAAPPQRSRRDGNRRPPVSGRLTLRGWVWGGGSTPGGGEPRLWTSTHPSPKTERTDRRCARGALPNAIKRRELPPRALRVCPADPKVCPERLSPSGGSSSPGRCAPGCPTCAPSRGFGAPWSVVCRRMRGIGFPLPPRPRVFHLGLAVSFVPVRPSFDEFHPLRAFRLCRVLRLRAALRAWSNLRPPNSEERLPWGPRPSSRRQQAASTIPQESRPSVTFRPRLSQSLDGFLRHLPCGLVSSRCHVQGLPFRDCLTAEPYRVSRRVMPLAVERNACDSDSPSTSGLAPRCECVSVETVGSRPSAPLMGFSSPGTLPATDVECLRIPPPRLHREEPLAAGPRVFAVARVGLPGIRLPTRQSFPA